MDDYGNKIVHAPEDSGVRMVSRTPTIHSFSFLSSFDD